MENKNISLNVQINDQNKSPSTTESQLNDIKSENVKTKNDKQKIPMASILFNDNNLVDKAQSSERRETIIEPNNANKIPYLKIDIKNIFSLSTERNTKRINKILTRYKKNFPDQKSHIENLINKFLI